MQARRGERNLFRRARREAVDQLAHRHRRDHRIGLVFAEVPGEIARPYQHAAVVERFDSLDGSPRVDDAAGRADGFRERLPHLAGSVGGVAKAVDESLGDRLRSAAGEHVAQQRRER